MLNKKYAFIVGVSEGYLLGLTALLNSIHVHNPNADIIIIAYRLPESFIKELVKESNIRIVYRNNGINSQTATAIYRFKVAESIGKQYDSICLLDADMFLTADCTRFFDVASKGFIITGSNGMIINFNRDYQKKYNINLGLDDYIYPLVHTTAPIFIDKTNLDWFHIFFDNRNMDNFDDFLYLNLLGIKLEKEKKMICLPPYVFTGIHHWQMKPFVGIIKKEGLLLSGTEELVYMVHGKWWWKGWTQDLWPTMEKYFLDNDINPKGIKYSERSISILYNEFKYYLNFPPK